MAEGASARCPSCSRYVGRNANFCPICGTALDGADEDERYPALPLRVQAEVHLPRASFLHTVMRFLFVVWLVAYPLISCAPVLIGGAAGGSAGGAAALGGLLVGGFILVPWLVGLLVLGILSLLTR